MLRLLFIEDEPESVVPAINSLKKRGYNCTVKNFLQTEDALYSFSPDVVILDILQGGATPEPEIPGKDAYKCIWETRFCPIVVYSARPEALGEKDHPFVKTVTKGRSSVKELMAVIDELQPHLEALHDAEKYVRKAFACALRDVAPHAFKVFSDPGQRNDAILRSGRRRLAAMMDDLSRHGELLASWEQYLSPPVNKDVQLGDVLIEKGKHSDDPHSFRVVLTPSCDLAASGDREPKVCSALVARCCCVRHALSLTSIGNMKPSKLKDRLPTTVLSQGYFEAIIPFPQLAGRIPHMAANLRDLELVPVNEIGLGDEKFFRVASVDSPFRELVSWAYMQIAGRPGLPDRDVKAWCDEIIALYKNDSQGEQA